MVVYLIALGVFGVGGCFGCWFLLWCCIENVLVFMICFVCIVLLACCLLCYVCFNSVVWLDFTHILLLVYF